MIAHKAPATNESASAGLSPGKRRRTRLAAVAAAVLAALAVWTIAEPLLGIAVMGPEMGDQPQKNIGAPDVLVTSAVASLAGWATLSLLERFTARAAIVWAGLAAVALLASMGAPLMGAGLSVSNRVVLVVLHVVVAAVLVPVLYRTSTQRP